MSYARGIGETAHGLAALIDHIDIGTRGAWEINLGVNALVQEKRMNHLDTFFENAHDRATIIGPPGLGFVVRPGNRSG